MIAVARLKYEGADGVDCGVVVLRADVRLFYRSLNARFGILWQIDWLLLLQRRYDINASSFQVKNVIDFFTVNHTANLQKNVKTVRSLA